MVHLVDAADEVGGHLRSVVELPGLREWGRFIDHRKILVDKLPNLQFIPSTTLSADDVRNYGATHVVVATGARWLGTGLTPGTHTPLEGVCDNADWVFTPEHLLVEGRRPPRGSRVTVYDTEGAFTGVGIAQLLSEEGYEVAVVTPHGQVAAEADLPLDGPAIRLALHQRGVVMHRDVSLTAAGPGSVAGVGEFDEPFETRSDALVLVTMRLPAHDLYHQPIGDRGALQEADIEGVYGIGDTMSPRPLAEVVFDGHRLAREFESANPTVALPYRREALYLDLPQRPGRPPHGLG